MLQIPAVQTGLARFASERLKSVFNGRLEIGAVQIHGLGAITMHDAVLIDTDPYTDSISGYAPADTVARVGRLSATLSLKGLFNKRGIALGRVEAEDLLFQLVTDPRGTNITRVLNLSSSEESKPMPLDSIFTIGRLDLKGAHFRMLNYNSLSAKDFGINFSDLDVTADLKAHALGFFGGRMHATVDRLTASEKSGYEVPGLSGTCHVGMGRTTLTSLHLTDGCGSDIYMPRAELSYDNIKAWSDFINQVNIEGDFAPSRIILESISYYSSGTFRDCRFATDIASGHFNGTVSDFVAENMVLSTPYGPYGTVSAGMRGLPNIQSTTLDADISELCFTTAGLSDALRALGSGANLGKLAPGVLFRLSGKAGGPMNKLTADAGIRSSIGSLSTHASLLNTVDRSKPIQFLANLGAKEFNLGKLSGSSALGPASFTALAQGTLGGNTAITLKGLDFSKLQALGYNYSDIHLHGGFENKTISATLLSDDPNAQMELAGEFSLQDKSGALGADLRHIDLAATGIDKRGGASQVSCAISADQGINLDAPIHILISDLKLTNDKGLNEIGDIEAEARLSGERLTAILASDFMDAKYFGPSNIAGLVDYIRSVSIDRELPAYFASGSPKKSKQLPEGARDATFTAVFHQTQGLLSFVMPGLKIASDTNVNIDIDNEGTLLGYLSSPELDFNTIHGSDLTVSLSNLDDELGCTVHSGQLSVKDLVFDQAGINFDIADNRIRMGMHYDGANLLEKGSELNLEAILLRDEKSRPSIDIRTLQSYLSIKDDVWRLSKAGIGLHAGEISFDGFRLASESQSISIDGCLSPSRRDTMTVSLSNLNLAIVNDFTPQDYPGIQGIIDGGATLLSPAPSDIGLWADLAVNGLSVAGRQAGDIALRSDWDDASKSIKLRLDNSLSGRKTLVVSGDYAVRSKQVEATVLMDGFNPAPAAPFLRSILTELDGRVSGSIRARGPIDKLSITSSGLQLENMRTRISYTNVAYTLNGRLNASDTKLELKDVAVVDDYGGKGTLNGNISYKNFKDFRMDATLLMRGLKAIDIPDADSPIMVYGSASLSGRGHIAGPFNALQVDADVSTSGPGTVNVPLGSSSTAHGSDLLTFKQPEPETDEDDEPVKSVRKSSSKFAAHARVRVAPEVIAQVEIDRESGHVLTAGGTGDVVVDLNTGKGKLQLKGDYNIDKGKYLFNIPGVVSKEFDIKTGSVLQFNGDVMESTMDVNAIHIVKTSLATIVADSTMVTSRRPVECGINIKGKLSNPDVKFSIDVPDLDPSTRMQVEGVLSTDDKVQKQFVALLLFGTFLPEEGSGVVNGTNMIASNVGEIVSSQLNNILQKLNIPLDLGLGYQQDNLGTDIFDVAVSTQLFNNRVLVNGSVGNRRYSTSKSANGDVVGDLDIEIKMDKSGELRFKIFSHSADEFTSSLDFSQRNGLGLTYQKEFDRTRDFLRQLFMSKKRRQEDNLKQMQRNREMNTITIE